MSVGIEHAEVNIRAPGLLTGPQDINKTVLARNRSKYQPRSSNNNATASATVCNFSNQIEFQFTTSNMQWVDLFNSHFFTRYTIAAVANAGYWSHLTQNLIASAYLYVNGVQVSFTNNWTVASQINKRIQFSKQYNKSVNNVAYFSDATVAASIAAPGVANNSVGGGYPYPTMAAGTYSDKEYLDGFFIRDRDSCWIPPNSDVRIVLICDPNCYLKAKRHPAADVTTDTCLINSVEFVAYSIMKPGVPWGSGMGGAEMESDDPADYVLKFITNSITSSAVGADCNRNLTVDKNIVKLAIAFQQAPVAAAANVIGGENLAYATQNERTVSTTTITGTAGAAQLNTLQVQLGSIVQPPQAYDFATNLHREAYEDYMMLTGKTISYETEESYLDWLTEPIYLFDFPRTLTDTSTSLIIRATRTAGGVAPQMHIVEMDEQLVNMKYDRVTGACVSTTTLK